MVKVDLITGKKGDRVVGEIVTFVIAAVIIVAAFAIIGLMIKDMPLWIQVLGGLFVIFVYAIRDRAMQFIRSLVK